MRTATKTPASEVERALHDPERLATLAELDLLGGSADETFDRMTRLAARLLDVPVSLVSLVDGARQYFRGEFGTLPEPFASERGTDLEHSFCKHVVADDAPLVVADAREDDVLRSNLAVRDLNVIAYLGVPLRSARGDVLGSFCAVDFAPRAWTQRDIDTIADLGELAAREIALRAEAHAIERDRARLNAILDNSGEGILGIDLGGRVTFANRAAEQLLGQPAQDLLGQDAHTLLHDADGTGAICGPDCVDNVLVRSGRTVSRDTMVTRKGGGTFPARYTAAMKQDHGTTSGVVILFDDRSAEVELEHQREELAERFRALFEHTQDAVLLTVPDGRIVEANEAACEMFGRSLTELRALGRAAVVDVTDPRLPALLEMRANRGFASGGIRMRRADGTTFEADISSTVFEDRAGRRLTSMSIRDISERVRLESELRQTAARLAERVDAELQFEAILGHELRTPLLAIMSFATLLRRNGMSMDRVKELAGYLEQDAERAQRLIDQLLDLDRVESGRAQLLIEPVNVQETLTQVVATLTPASPRHAFTLSGASDAVVLADRDRLIQVFTNLLVNAVKYSPDGGEVEIGVTNEAGRVHVRIRDHGLGIPPTQLEQIFQKHTRVHTARDIKGSGLGLQLVRAIVDLHGGRVWAESEGEGRGATLHVLLTAAPAADAEARE